MEWKKEKKRDEDGGKETESIWAYYIYTVLPKYSDYFIQLI